MAAKAIFFIFIRVLLLQYALNQCVNTAGFPGPCSPSVVYDSLGIPSPNRGYDGLITEAWSTINLPCIVSIIEYSPTTGGIMPITSVSAIPPTGISVLSENAYKGCLAVAGEVPFVGTTGMEGTLPTGGAGAIDYGCGSGVTSIVSELAPAIPFGPVISDFRIVPGTAPLRCGAIGREY